MNIPELKDFYLVGGTALALYYGHRLSVDLDLFSTVNFNSENLLPILEKNFDGFTYSNINNPVGLTHLPKIKNQPFGVDSVYVAVAANL